MKTAKTKSNTSELLQKQYKQLNENAEKLSTEIAVLERQSEKSKNPAVKKVLTKKIDKLKVELKDLTSAAAAKEKLASAKTKVAGMSNEKHEDYITKLAENPKYAFLKNMTNDEIKRDESRVAKPVGYRFKGNSVKKPSKKAVKDGQNVYYESRRNRSDVSRVARLATGGALYEDLKVGTVFQGKGFPMLKGIDDGNYYTIIETDKQSATFVKSDSKGGKKGKTKFRHYLSSLDGAITTASRGDNNGIVLINHSHKFDTGGGVEEKNNLSVVDFEKKIKDLMKQENKWHFVGENVDGKQVKMKFFVGKKEIDVQIFTIDNMGARMPRNYSGKRDTVAMIMENFKASMKDGGPTTAGLFAGGGSAGEGFLIRDIKKELSEKFRDSFGFTVHKFDESGDKQQASAALLVDHNGRFYGLEDKDIKSKLFFPQYKRDHNIRFRIYQGGENTYFYFVLESENGDQYIGQFGFKDRGDVSPDYITRFMAYLMEQYGLPFQVNHSVMAKGGPTTAGLFAEPHKIEMAAKGMRVSTNWTGNKSKETWGKHNLYEMYDNTLHLMADLHDYFKQIESELGKAYSDEAKNELINVLKSGELKGRTGKENLKF